MKQIAVVDYGMGNLHSVASALRHVAPDASVLVTSDAAQILCADHVVFPGVGAIGDCMAEITRLQLQVTLAQVVQQKQPLLGICVGMQAMMTHSEESGGVDCFNWFNAPVKLFQGDVFKQHQLKVPHMGWNNVKQSQEHALWHGIEDNARFYFVHSYYVELHDKNVLAYCQYGVPFAAAVARDNIAAVQFHPEKSQAAGLTLLKNFIGWNGQ